MKRLLFSVAALFFTVFPVPAARAQEFDYRPATTVVYNGNNPTSRDLAMYYARARGIPAENLVGLKCPDAETVSREDFKKTIEGPLRAAFTERGWWKTAPVAGQGTIAVQTRIRVIALIRGMPLRVSEDPVYGEPDPKTKRREVIPPEAGKSNAASVDSELCLLGALDRPDVGPMINPYFGKTEPFYKIPITPVFLVGRLDGPDDATVKRLVDDALAAEKTGLYGRAFIDLAQKNDPGYKIGEDWLRAVMGRLELFGIPTVVDSWPQTFPENFPMTDTAVYFGWYTQNADGPFLSPGFKFRQGAIACHIHSFSATTLRTAKDYWCGPLLAKGACVVLGNTWEPYLGLCAQLDKFNAALLEGRNAGEAAWSATQGLSWMNVLIGDPLYRPFPKDAGVGDKTVDPDYKALRMAMRTWGGLGGAPSRELTDNLWDAAKKLKSGVIYEFLGLHSQAGSAVPDRDSAAWFSSAEKTYTDPADKIRVRLEEADARRRAGKTKDAKKTLESIAGDFPQAPAVKAAAAWLNQLNPPK